MQPPPFFHADRQSATHGALTSWPRCQLHLEDAHAETRRAGALLERLGEPTFDPRPAALATERATQHIFDAFDGRADPWSATTNAAAALDEAMTILATIGAPASRSIIECLSRARAATGHALDAVAPYQPRPGFEPTELRASIDVPRQHDVRRPSIVLPLSVRKLNPVHAVVLPPAIPRPRSFAELRDAVKTLESRAQEAQQRLSARPQRTASQRSAVEHPAPAAAPAMPGFAHQIDAAMDDVAFLRDRTRASFEDVTMVGMQRTPLLGDSWRSSLLLERRMLASIDLIASMGAVAIAHVPRLVADAPVADPSRVFAAGMILGSVTGRDALAAAERVLFTVGEVDEASVAELGVALSIAPHDLIPLAMRTLRRESNPVIRAMAMTTLGHRGAATQEELAEAAADHPLVACSALVQLAATFGVVPNEALERALGSDDPALQEAGLQALALAGAQSMNEHLATRLSGPHEATAAMLLALAGNEHDAALLLRRAQTNPTCPLVTALGWAGATTAVGTLVDLLDREENALRAAAAWALERITGAGLWEEVEVPAEDIDVPEPPSPDVVEPETPRLAEIVSHPKDRPEPAAPDRIEQPSMDAARWRAFFQQNGHAFAGRARYRMGAPYSPLVSLGELDAARRTPAERRLLQWELIIRTGAFVRFSTHDFVRVQEAALQAWRAHARPMSSAPGQWARPPRKRS